MARRTVTAGPLTYVIADEDPAALDLRWWAVLRTRVVDEITGAPPNAPVRIVTDTPKCRPRAAANGVCGLVARPRDVSPALLDRNGLRAEIEVPGYLALPLTAAIDAARRSLPGGATLGDPFLTMAPAEPPIRRQFRPGRGVLMRRTVPDDPDEFTRVREVAGVVPDDQVPLEQPVRTTRGISPMTGVPIVLADQLLHHASPARLTGRARRQILAGSAPTAAPATRLGISGVWWTNAEVRANTNPPHPPDFVSLSAPLSFAHARGATVEDCTLTPDGVPRGLTDAAHRGDTVVSVRPWNALNAAGGDVLELDRAPSAERELVVTAPFTPPSSAAAPAAVPLRARLAFPHRVGTAVALVAVATAPLGTVGREAQAGDLVLFGAGLAGAATESVVRLEGATATSELRYARRPPVFAAGFSHRVTFDPDGRFELPPLARVAQVRIHAEHNNQAVPPDVDFAPDYRGDNQLQILFTP
jgi:hypothetical protein